MKYDEKYMEYAIQEGKKAIAEGNFPFGCCIVSQNGEIITEHNKALTSKSPLAHAEMLAIWKMQKKNCFNSDNWSIYCTTKPCIMCLGAIYWSGIKNVFYGSDIIKLKVNGLDDIDYDENNMDHISDKISLIGGCMEKKCSALLNEWYKKNQLRLAYINFRRKKDESE